MVLWTVRTMPKVRGRDRARSDARGLSSHGDHPAMLARLAAA
jgi:hypothetical protein